MKLYSIGKCPNCTADCWKRDVTAWRLKRYECFYCGQDIYLNRPTPDKLREMYREEADIAA